MAPRRKNIAATLVSLINDSGISRYRISQMSGVSEAQLSRLVNGVRPVRMDTAEKIAEAIGYRVALIPTRTSKSQKRQRKG